MKYLIFVFGFVCLVLRVNGEKIDKYVELRKICSTEVGLQKEDISASDIPAFLQNPKSGCYLSCFLLDLEAIDENNAFDVEESLSLIDEEVREKLRPLFTKCGQESESITEKCEKAHKLGSCLYDGAPSIIQGLDVLERVRETA